MMQMNIYVPKSKEALLAALERAAGQVGRPKNELVLEALEQYLAKGEKSAEIPLFRLGTIEPGAREELYRERLDR